MHACSLLNKMENYNMARLPGSSLPLGRVNTIRLPSGEREREAGGGLMDPTELKTATL
jgi:hypothetical protein